MIQERKDKMFRDVASEIAETLVKKNHDYGDSFHAMYAQFGDVSTYIRLSDKLGRLANLVKQVDMRVNEPIDDVYRDIAGYCILTLVSRARLNVDNPYGIDETLTRCLVCREQSVPIKEGGVQLCNKCDIAHRVVKSESGGSDYILLNDPAKPKNDILIACAMCRHLTIPEKEGVHWCTQCGVGHDIKAERRADGGISYHINPVGDGEQR